MNKKPSPKSLFGLLTGGLATTVGLCLLLLHRIHGGDQYVLLSGMVLTVVGCCAILCAAGLVPVSHDRRLSGGSSGPESDYDGCDGSGDGGD